MFLTWDKHTNISWDLNPSIFPYTFINGWTRINTKWQVAGQELMPNNKWQNKIYWYEHQMTYMYYEN